MQGAKAVSGGELGMAVTRARGLFDRMLLVGHFGRIDGGQAETDLPRHRRHEPGRQVPCPSYVAAIARCHLARLPELNRLRTRNYRILNDILRGTPGLDVIDPLPDAERGGFLEFKFVLDPGVLGISRERFAEACRAEGAPVTVDRYSALNFTYGLLHLAPLYNHFDRRSLGGCFYDPARPELAHGLGYLPGALPVTEGLCQRLVSLPALTDVPEAVVAQIGAALRKVALHTAALR